MTFPDALPPRRYLLPLFWLVLLLVSAWGMGQLDFLFRAVEPDAKNLIYDRQSLSGLLLNHLFLVGLSAVIATTIGVSAGILVTREGGRDFLPLVSQLASIGQTFPPVAVLALSVPMLGFGATPTIVSLILYGLLPVVRNTIAGIDGINPSIREAATGMGMSPVQALWQIELPLAANVIIAGIRTSVTINIATAAIGSTVGARTLGDPIIAGLVNGNTAYVLQGAILIGLLALTVDSLFEGLERKVRR